MGSRIVLCGSIQLSAAAFKKAQKKPILELFFIDDEGNAEERGLTPPELFSGEDGETGQWGRNTYDPKTETWLFSCSLHDDDWANCSPTMLPTAVAALKDRPGTDVVFAFVEPESHLDGAWLIKEGKKPSTVARLPEVPKAVAQLLRGAKMEKGVAQLRRLLVPKG